MNIDIRYEQFIDELIASELQVGVVSWNTLLKRLPGVTPDVVLKALHRCNLQHCINFSDAKDDLGNSDGFKAFRLWSAGVLPTPHVLDACWWFSDTSLSLLSARVGGDIGANRVVLLGTPTLFYALTAKSSDFELLALLDSDKRLSHPHWGAGRVIAADVLRDELPKLTADVVIADPPWYEKELCGFLWAARSFCRNGGMILISVPPEGTRPGMKDEWSRVLKWTEQLGLTLAGHERGCLSYLSPPFERNALHSAGAKGVHIDWRRGDLATFICSHAALCARPVASSRVIWSDYNIDGVRLRLRSPAADDGENLPELGELVPGSILPTVSRRAPLLQSIDLWTSGNRVFHCKGRFVIGLILNALEHSEDPICYVKTIVGSLSFGLEAAISRVASKLGDVLERETRENQALQQLYEKRMDSGAYRDGGRPATAG